MDEIATDRSWRFATEGSQIMARTNHFRASMMLAAMMAAVLMAVLLVGQKPAAGIVIDDGLCLPWGGNDCPPETEITHGPSGTVSAYYVLDWATFDFTGSDDRTAIVNLKFECRLDSTSDNDWIPCTAPKEYTGLSDGSHTFQVRAKDASGRIDATPASRTWRVDTTLPPTPDTTPPETRITSYPTGPSPRVSFDFAGRDDFGRTAVADLKFQCRLDGSDWGDWEPSCTSPREYIDLSNGWHNFEVRAKDLAGNVEPDPASYQFRVDTTPPDTIITSHPLDPSNGIAPAFSFFGRDDVSNILYFKCRNYLSETEVPPWSICRSTHTLPEISTSGTYTFEVAAVDGWGRPDPTPASYTWTVDATAPSAPLITSPVEDSTFHVRSFTVSGTAEANTTVELFEGTASKGKTQVNASGEWSIELTGVSDGSHSYKAKATDAAGNASSESEARRVIVDATAPDAPVIISPAEGVRLNVRSLTLSGTAESGAKVELFEDAVSKGEATAGSDGAWSIELVGVSDGSHSYKAKATDEAGHASAESEARTVIVDATAPAVRRVVPAENTKGIAPGANVSAVFSEAMKATSINANTIKLYKKGSTIALAATVTYDATAKRAVLNPSANLQRGVTYKAVVSVGVRDLAGNALDQDLSVAGNQQKAWVFTVST